MSLDTLGFTRKQLRDSFNYLFRGSSNKEFRANFEKPLQAKQAIDRHGYMLMNCKLYAWSYAKGEKPRAKDFRITTKDARFLRTLDLSHVSQDWPSWGLDEFRTAIEEQLWSPHMDQYIGKFISKKLIFLRSYGLKRPDIVNELRLGALYAVYRMFPFYHSLNHIQNIGKMAFKNTGQSLIYTHTRQSRQVMVRNANGSFESLLVPMDAPTESGTIGDMIEAMPANGGFDVTHHMGKLSAAYDKCKPRAQRFISLLLGQHDQEFSRFLGRNNSLVYERIPFDDYCLRVQAHMGVSDKQRRTFFRKIRRL